jgi:hypothetical protein
MQTRLAALVLLAIAGCGYTPAILKPGSIHAGDAITVLGFDFSGASFHDDYFRHDDLLRTKIPPWNVAASGAMVERLTEFSMGVDLARSTERNRAVTMEALASGYRAMRDEPSALAPWLRPYLGPPGKGLVVFVDWVSKSEGVRAKAVLFDRTNGAILLAITFTEAGEGWGVYQFYLKPLQEIAAHVASVLRDQAGR